MATQERRKSGRIDSLNLSYVLIDGDENEAQRQTMGRTLNVSEDGIRLETHIAVATGTLILVSIGLEDEVIDIKGRAIYCTKNESGKFELGIEFIDLDSEAGKILKTFKEEHSKDG